MSPRLALSSVLRPSVSATTVRPALRSAEPGLVVSAASTCCRSSALATVVACTCRRSQADSHGKASCTVDVSSSCCSCRTHLRLFVAGEGLCSVLLCCAVQSVRTSCSNAPGMLAYGHGTCQHQKH